MAQNVKSVKKVNHRKNIRKKKRQNRTAAVFWVVLIIFLIPFFIFGWILLSAAMDTGSPILGSRYENDLNPAITKADMDTIKSNVASLAGVEKSDVQLATGTLRVYAKIADSSSEADADSTASAVYNTVTSVLDPSTYFSQHDGEKMYDLEVHVYNLDQDRNSDSFVYVIETKTSNMSAPVQQTVSKPIDAALAESLRQDVIDRKNGVTSSSSSSTASPDASSAADQNTVTSSDEEVVNDEGNAGNGEQNTDTQADTDQNG